MPRYEYRINRFTPNQPLSDVEDWVNRWGAQGFKIHSLDAWYTGGTEVVVEREIKEDELRV